MQTLNVCMATMQASRGAPDPAARMGAAARRAGGAAAAADVLVAAAA